MKIKTAEKLSSGTHLHLYRISYEDKNRADRKWDIVSREAHAPKCISGRYEPADAVVIVPFHMDRKRLVIIREYRVPLGNFQYGFPAGLVDPGETIEQTAKRELKEETGLDLVDIVKTSPPVYSSSGLTDESISLVYVNCSGALSDAGNRGSELIEPRFISQEQAEHLCSKNGELIDVKTWIVLSHYGRTGNIE